MSAGANLPKERCVLRVNLCDFYKEDDVMTGSKVVFCPGKGRVARQVTTYQYAFRMSKDVTRVGRNHVLRHPLSSANSWAVNG